MVEKKQKHESNPFDLAIQILEGNLSSKTLLPVI